jgi:hypothetical protein
MAQTARVQMPSSYIGWGGLLIGGVLASLALPKLWSVGRKAVRRVGGITYRDQASTGEPTSVDPALGRAA